MKLIRRDQKYVMQSGIWIEAVRFWIGPFSWVRIRTSFDGGAHTLTHVTMAGWFGKIFGGWRPPAWFANLLWEKEKILDDAEIVENTDDPTIEEISSDV